MSYARLARPILAAALAAATSTLVYAQAAAPGRWACTVNGKAVDIQIANEEATVSVNGERRVLKRRDVNKGTMYTDGTVALRQGGMDPTSRTQDIENGNAATLERCVPVAG